MPRVALLAMLALAAACSSAPVPSASPSDPPGTKLASPSPSLPIASATVSPATSQVVEHPTGPTDVVLRMWRSGGFLYPGTTLDEAPIFTLYGDGHVIYSLERPRPDGSVIRELRLAQLTEEQVGALLENALGSGGLAQARESYADVPMADGTTTNFEINAGGAHKTVAVYALGEYEEPGPDAAEREAFTTLAEGLRDFDAEVAAGNATDLGEFEPERYRVSIFPDVAGELAPTADWPWSDLEPSDFPRDNSGFGHLVVSAAQGELVAELPIGDIGDPVVSGQDGTNYLVRARPLLPDEVP